MTCALVYKRLMEYSKIEINEEITEGEWRGARGRRGGDMSSFI